jgi:beta-aspartyl-peptidase (threonine type)
MTSRALALLGLLGPLLAAPACVAPAEVEGTEHVHDALAQVLHEQQAAWNAGDVAGFMRSGYWDSEETTFLSGGSWTRGFAAVQARFQDRYTEEDAEMGELQFTELETLAVSPKAGLARGRWQLTFADGSETGGLFTLLVCRQSDGRWRIVHDHTSSGE